MALKPRTYTSDAIDIQFDLRRCIHAEECIHGHAAVFQRTRKPWVDATQGTIEDIVAVIHKCPTGALTYHRKDGVAEQPPGRNKITIDPDGPLFVQGAVELVTAAGTSEHTRVALCRCGASNNKPYCDNSHRDVEFKDPGNFERQPATAELGGPLRLTVRANGSILVEGNLILESGDRDHAMLCSGRMALCRCGHSDNKPFCDSSHKEAGFEAE